MSTGKIKLIYTKCVEDFENCGGWAVISHVPTIIILFRATICLLSPL